MSLFHFAGIALILLTGCATTTLDRALTQCMAEGGKPSYQRSDITERFDCK